MTSRRARLLRLGKYVLFQVPGWVLIGAGAAAAHRFLGLDERLALGAFAAWVLKDALLYPFVRHAYDVEQLPASAGMLERTALAMERIAPEGRVRVGPELWRARLAPGEPEVEPGAEVRIVAVEGLTLRVAALRKEGRNE